MKKTSQLARALMAQCKARGILFYTGLVTLAFALGLPFYLIFHLPYLLSVLFAFLALCLIASIFDAITDSGYVRCLKCGRELEGMVADVCIRCGGRSELRNRQADDTDHAT